MTIIRRLGRDAAYNLLGLPLAIASFGLSVTLFAAGVGTLGVFVGLGVLAAALLVARGFADIERLRLERLHGGPVSRPRYRAAPADAGWVRRMTNPLRQGQSWLDLLYGILNLPLAIIAFVFTVTWWAMAVGGVTYWIWRRFIPQGDGYHNVVVEKLLGADTEANRVTFFTVVGVFAALTVYGVQRVAAAVRAGFASVLLARLAQLQGRIDDLAEGRAAAVSAEAVALRKLERDIHDGPQQRLILLAMELSRARRRLADDPDAAAQTIDGALGQAKETLDELRALSRGIAPPVLADRGLAAALNSLASRSTVPVELVISVESRLRADIENALYFVAAEALSNIAKHSAAACARLELTGHDGRVYLMVTDDGVGGAHLNKGHGLAGLADRLRAIDGEFAVDSPAGGPTILVAQAPATALVA